MMKSLKPLLGGGGIVLLCVAGFAACDNPLSSSDEEPLTADVTFIQTETDEAHVVFDIFAWDGDGTASETWGLSAQETGKADFKIRKAPAQTITVHGADAAKITQSITGASDGASISLFSVDTSTAWIDDKPLAFTFTVAEANRSPKTISVTLKVVLNLNAGVVIYHVNGDGTLTDKTPPAVNGAGRDLALDQAFRWVDANAVSHTEYLLRLNADQKIPKECLLCRDITSVTIRLRGAGAERTITRDILKTVYDDSLNPIYSNFGGLIHVGAYSLPNTSYITLKLENNITIDGKGEEYGTGTLHNPLNLHSLLSAAGNCTVILEAGSKLTGYKGIGWSSYTFIAVEKLGRLKIMKGAQITGNILTGPSVDNPSLIYIHSSTNEGQVQLQRGFEFGDGNTNNYLSCNGYKYQSAPGRDYIWFDEE